MTFDPTFTLAMTIFSSMLGFACYEIIQVRYAPRAKTVSAFARRERPRR